MRSKAYSKTGTGGAVTWNVFINSRHGGSTIVRQVNATSQAWARTIVEVTLPEEQFIVKIREAKV